MDHGALCGHLRSFWGNNNEFGLFRTTLTPTEQIRLANNFEGGMANNLSWGRLGRQVLDNFQPFGNNEYTLMGIDAFEENVSFMKPWQEMTLDERKKLVELCLKLHELNTDEARFVADYTMAYVGGAVGDAKGCPEFCIAFMKHPSITRPAHINQMLDYNYTPSDHWWEWPINRVSDLLDGKRYPLTHGKEVLLTIQNQLNQQQPENTQEALPAINSEQQQPTTHENEQESPVPNAGDELVPVGSETPTDQNNTQSVTPQPATPQTVTPQPVTPQSVTPQPATPQPVTPQSLTPQPATPQPVTPQSVTPQPTTPQPVTPQSLTSQPTTSRPTNTPTTPALSPNTQTPEKEDTQTPIISAQAAAEQKSFLERNWQWIIGAVAAVAAAIGAYFLLKKQKKKTKEAKNEVNSLKEQVSTLQDKINELSENGNNSTNNNNNSGNSNSDNSSSGLAGNSTRIYTHDEIIADINLLRSSNNSTSNG